MILLNMFCIFEGGKKRFEFKNTNKYSTNINSISCPYFKYKLNVSI